MKIKEFLSKRKLKKEENNRFKMIPDKKKSYKWLIFPILCIEI